MKDSNTLSTNLFDSGYCILYDLNDINYINYKWHKIDQCSTLKKSRNNKIRKCILTLSHFLTEVIYTPELEIKIFHIFPTKLQPHSLKVSSKKKSFSM